jgi:hypothetical protein
MEVTVEQLQKCNPKARVFLCLEEASVDPEVDDRGDFVYLDEQR